LINRQLATQPKLLLAAEAIENAIEDKYGCHGKWDVSIYKNGKGGDTLHKKAQSCWHFHYELTVVNVRKRF
jgi:hypothetical protein